MMAAEMQTGRRRAAASGVAGWLSLAAAPTFAVMAILTSVPGGMDMACMAGHGASPLNGMATMYVLMSTFHSGPWVKRISPRRSQGEASSTQFTPCVPGDARPTN